MSVDKFGHYSRGKGGGGVESQQSMRKLLNLNFAQTPSGDYDLLGKRLHNVKDPHEKTDVVTLDFAKKHFTAVGDSLIYDPITDRLNAKKRKIGNVDPPETKNDVVTLEHMESKCLVKDFDKVSGKNVVRLDKHKLTDVADGEMNSDAVTVGQLIGTNKTMLNGLIKEGVDLLIGHHTNKPRTSDSAGNLSDEIKIKLKALVDAQKIAFTTGTTKRSTADNTIQLSKSTNAFDAKNKRVENLGDAINDKDAVNKQIMLQYITQAIDNHVAGIHKEIKAYVDTLDVNTKINAVIEKLVDKKILEMKDYIYIRH